jgi:large conductance mechanosensitive channel
MSVSEEFKAFITKGNVIQLAVAFIIGAAFTALVTAFVTDLATPLIGLPGSVDFASWSYSVHGATFHPGLFINALIAFLLIAAVVFFAIVRPVDAMERRAAAKKAAAPPTQKDCPFCKSKIDIAATRCAFCTSNL